jgi:hypothetical protein
MAQVKTYVRPMGGWWRRDPYFTRYMIREASSVFLAIYAIVLLVGLLRLTQGRKPTTPARGAARLHHFSRGCAGGGLSRLYLVKVCRQDRS